MLFVPHFSQQLKINKISLKSFPKIKLTISIENKWGTPIPLNIKEMKLFENKKEVLPISVKAIDTVKTPIYTVIIIDKSGSMKGDAIKMAKDGAISFVKMMIGSDNTAYIEFDTNVNLVSDFLIEKKKIESFIKNTIVGSDTAFLDALYTGLELLKKTPLNSVKIILALTDGKENKSSKKLSDIISLANSIEVPIYTIGLGNKIDAIMLKKIAKETHANFYNAPKPDQLIDIYRKISLLLHSQLVITFKTIYEMDSKWHNLKIIIPYVDGFIESEKSYLSAKKSKISTKLLGKIRLEIQKKKIQTQIKTEKLRKKKERRKKKEEKIIYILFIILIIILIVLIVLIYKKKQEKYDG